MLVKGGASSVTELFPHLCFFPMSHEPNFSRSTTAPPQPTLFLNHHFFSTTAFLVGTQTILFPWN